VKKTVFMLRKITSILACLCASGTILLTPYFFDKIFARIFTASLIPYYIAFFMASGSSIISVVVLPTADKKFRDSNLYTIILTAFTASMFIAICHWNILILLYLRSFLLWGALFALVIYGIGSLIHAVAEKIRSKCIKFLCL